MEKGSMPAPAICRLIFTLLGALIAVSPGMAQQGSIYLTYAPFTLPTMTDRGGLITFSPIGAVDGKTIRLLSDDGKTFTFTLNAKTIYCQGSKESTGWAYLKKMAGQKTSITVMTNEGATDALVVWDQGPKLTRGSGTFPNIDFPPLCRAGALVSKRAGAAANAPSNRPPAAPVRATAATPRLSISVPGEVQAARLIRQIKPGYPPLAKMARIQGTVRLSAVIGTDGAVRELHVVSGPPMLVQPALEAVRQWMYTPTLSNGEPAQVVTTINVNFALDE